MVDANTTYRCDHCGQLLPFNSRRRVPQACLRRCQSGCDWHPVGATTSDLINAASHDGPINHDTGLPTLPEPPTSP